MFRLTTILLISVLFLILTCTFTSAQTTWMKYQGNPVVESGPSSGWEKWIGDPCVLFDGNTYHMWYTGFDTDYGYNIGYASSQDGKIWYKDSVNNPVLEMGPEGSIDDDGAGYCSVLLVDNVFHLWYGSDDSQGEKRGRRICHATSDDGIIWVKDSLNNPVLDIGPAGSWEAASIYASDVLFDGSVYHMWYAGYMGLLLNDVQIGHATSPDGIVWTKDMNNPVLSYGEWDTPRVDCPEVIFDGATFHMWYGGGSNWSWRLGYATSTNGSAWTKEDSQNPCLDFGPEASWEERYVALCSVLYDSVTEIYKMWYTGGYAGFEGDIGYAVDLSNSAIPYSDSLALDATYLQPLSDTLQIDARILNPANHALSAQTLFVSSDGTVEDSTVMTPLGEDMWIATMTAPVEEKYYSVGIKTIDEEAGTSHNGINWNIEKFTTIGPLTANGLEYEAYNSELRLHDFKLILANEGSTTTAEDIKAYITTDDPRIEYIVEGKNNRSFGDIPAGQTAVSTKSYSLKYAEGYQDYDTWPHTVALIITVASKGENYWQTETVFSPLLPLLNDAWTKKAPIPTSRWNASSCELDGKMYVIGGGSSLNSGLNTMEVYDPTTDTWDTTKTAMPTPRQELCVAAVNGKIYAIGGAYSHDGTPLGTVEVYDPLNDTWDTRTPTPTPRKGAAFGVINDMIYIAGGSAFPGFKASDKLEIYDTVSDTWTTGADMLAPRYGPQGVVLNDTFFVIGGLIGYPWDGQNTVQKYVPTTDEWENGPSLNHGRVGHAAHVVNGRIHVIGGDKQPPRIENVEEYDPQTGLWAVRYPTPHPMISFTSCVYDNMIYIFSGSIASIWSLGLIDSVYCFDAILGIEESPKFQTPNNFVLHQNYPNPFNPQTTIDFTLPQHGLVQLKVFNVLGQRVAQLLSDKLQPGRYSYNWDASHLASGVYYYELQAGDFRDVKKMVLLR